MIVGVLTLPTVLVGLLAGNELGTLTVSHPALDRLPLPTQIAAERVLTRRLGRIMPFVMTTTIAVTVVASALLVGEPGFAPAALAAVALIAMLAITLIGNVPRTVGRSSSPTTEPRRSGARSGGRGSGCTRPASPWTSSRSSRSFSPCS